MKKSLIAGLLIMVVLVSGCTSVPDTAPQTAAPQPTPTASKQNNVPPTQIAPQPKGAATVEISDFTFFPAEVILAKGGTVTWKQKDTEQHTVTGADFSSSKLSQGETFTHTFNEAGTFEYWCTIHASMRGKITVK